MVSQGSQNLALGLALAAASQLTGRRSRKEILGQACNSAILARIGFVEAREG